MTDFFLRDRDAQLAQGAQHLDDIDTVPSKEKMTVWGPAIVVTAVRQGNHACWYCGGYYNPADKKLKPVEVELGTARVLLHAGCVDKKPRSQRSFDDVQRGLTARRFFAQAVKKVTSVLGVESKDADD
jgi:hypothetical protein